MEVSPIGRFLGKYCSSGHDLWRFDHPMSSGEEKAFGKLYEAFRQKNIQNVLVSKGRYNLVRGMDTFLIEDVRSGCFVTLKRDKIALEIFCECFVSFNFEKGCVKFRSKYYPGDAETNKAALFEMIEILADILSELS